MQKSCLNYPVEIVSDVFGADATLAKVVEGRRTFLVADANVVQRTEGLGLRIGRYVQERGISLVGSPVVLGGGEKAKLDDFQSVRRVLGAALEADLGPDDIMIVLGGGSVMDVAGYAAAQVRGGLPLLLLPTTPAAMMDGAFFEEACLDTPREKDALRLPVRVNGVIIDLSFARTVLDGVWRGGVSEAVRSAAAFDISALARLRTRASRYFAREETALGETVAEALDIRRTNGWTDLGLSAAAGLEEKSEWKLPHGYAVAMGLLDELLASVQRKEVGEDVLLSARAVLEECGALDGLQHSRHIISPELSSFLIK